MSVKEFGLDPDGKLGLSPEDAVSLGWKFFGMDNNMVTIIGLVSALSSWAAHNNNGNEFPWFSGEGCKCEILRTKGGGWQKGRFRLRLEFIPDNPEEFFKKPPSAEEKPQSPLDDLRSHLDI